MVRKLSWGRRWLAGGMTAMLVCSLFANPVKSASFEDIEDSFAREAINYVYEQGIMQGVSPTSFAPEQTISRQEFALVLAKTWGIQPYYPAQPTFTDLGPTQDEYGYVEALVHLGILTGTSPSTFSGDKPLTRQDAAVILTRALANPQSKANLPQPNYLDSGQIAPYAQEAVSYVTTEGLMSGHEQRFSPQQALTRAETAVLAQRLLERGNLVGDYFWNVQPRVLELKVGESEQIKLLSQEDLLAYTPVFGLDNPELGTISPDGRFTAVQPGQGLLTVNIGKRYHQIVIRVHE